MNIDFSNLSIRSSFYFVTAPQDGYVVQAKVSGVGENIAEGDVICTIMPSDPSLAIQLYVQPMDIPLLEKGRKVRLQFDGWPALVFSGWPNYSFGTFGGVVAVIDNFDTQESTASLLFRILMTRPGRNRYGSAQVRSAGSC